MKTIVRFEILGVDGRSIEVEPPSDGTNKPPEIIDGIPASFDVRCLECGGSWTARESSSSAPGRFVMGFYGNVAMTCFCGHEEKFRLDDLMT